MREIKFRAWSEFNGIKEMLYSDTPKQNYKITPFGVFASDKHNYQYTSYTLFGKDYPIMQFTGLKDKNEADIYEGDIIKVPSDDYDYCLCEWNNKNCCFQINGYGRNMYFNEGGGEEFSNDITMVEEHVWVLGGDDNIEVIGNIYQNTNLLNPLT